MRPEATEKELVTAGRVASVLITVFGGAAAFFANDVATVFRLVIAIGTGPGVVLILRWFWWRINAWAELSAMVAGFLVGLVEAFGQAYAPTFSQVLIFVLMAVGEQMGLGADTIGILFVAFTLAIYAFMEAADASKRQNGAAVDVAQVLEEAAMRARDE